MPEVKRSFSIKYLNRQLLRLVVVGVVALAMTALLTFGPQESVSAQRQGMRAGGGGSTPRRQTSSAKSRGEGKDRDRESQQTEPERGEFTATPLAIGPGIQQTADQIMSVQARTPFHTRPLLEVEKEAPERDGLPQNPNVIDAPQWPPAPEKSKLEASGLIASPQTLGVTFDGATGPTETGAFPPDTMGAVGPTQCVVFLNGRLRTFTKAGVADGALNVDSDVFFASVLTPPNAGEVSFTSDPNVRYDRLSKRWFITIIDVTINSTTQATTHPNRVLMALTDAASNGTITGSTVFTLYEFQADATLFADYPSLGIDANALYIGADMFTLAGSFSKTNGFVIPKAALLTGSTLNAWTFAGLATGAGAGPFAPRGVDNPDPTNTGPTAVGYFIGADNASFSTLTLRRVTNPGSTGPAPTISANISIATTIATQEPVLVPHLGNTGGNNGRLDSLDDRLYAAVLRNGRLWTAHNIGVNNTGTTTGTRTRSAARWYEIQNLNATPTVVQAGTLFDNTGGNVTTQRNYWIPSITVSGQGHAVLGCSISGTNEHVNAFTTGRLAGDTLGTMRDGPGGVTLPGYTASSTAYNPSSDPGGAAGRRWGDYSFTSVDPNDDMTIWTIQEYCNGANTYGVRFAQLIAPPPATPATAVPGAANQNVASTNVTITGTAVSGSGFFDPGPDTGGPGFAHHIAATVSGGVTVNSIAYNSPTSVTLNVSTVGASVGMKDITIINPDGQSKTGSAVFAVTSPTAAPANIGGKVATAGGAPLPGVRLSLLDTVSLLTVTTTTGTDGHYMFANAPTGDNYVITPTRFGFNFNPANQAFAHTGERTNVDFTASADASALRAAPYDFDGDGKTDIAVWRPSDATWYIFLSQTGTMRTVKWGLPDDRIVPADYDGDGKTDIAVWRPSNGTWYIINSSDGSVRYAQFGTSGDVPVPGYYDGDNRSDVAVFRPANGAWYVTNSADNSFRSVLWGSSSDRPVVGDFDGDGRADPAVFRPSDGTWYVLYSSNNSSVAQAFGAASDLLAPGDFDGDGRADLAVFRSGAWIVQRSLDSAVSSIPFGVAGDRPVPGDYDGDGRTDTAVFRPLDGTWYLMLSSTNKPRAQPWGKSGDVPVPSAFIP